MKRLPLLLLAALGAAAAALAAPAQKPNFIVINIDDLGYADIAPFGSTNRTPHLDRMAREGRLLTSHYAAPVCSPSRAALLTGCYPKRVLPIPHVLFPVAAVGLSPDERTIAEVLKEAGYATAAIGKWHLGDQAAFLPTRQGFDYFYGLPYSNDMGLAADGARSSFGKPPPQPKKAAKVAKAATPSASEIETGLRGNAQPPLALVENETVIARVRHEEQRALTARYTEKAVEYIRAHREGPFFLYLPHTAVHFPLYPAEGFAGQSPNGLLGDWAQEVDASVGRVLDTLRELGLAERTLVIFTSDNGGSVPHGSNNTPLRGSKGQTFEGGIRVCTIAWWPGRIPAGTKTGAITTMMDVLPTLAGLAGARATDGRRIDGVDIWPALAGTGEPRREFFYYRGLALEAVRSGPWKLHLAKGELYQLEHDIAETTDLAARQPEVVGRLRALARTMQDDLGLEGVGPGCRPLGRVADPQPLIAADGTVRAGHDARFQRLP